jgi:hypothetical protein
MIAGLVAVSIIVMASLALIAFDRYRERHANR